MYGVRLKGSQRKVSPPGPTFMSDDQLGTYLRDLRTSRPPRPNGSRPLPPKDPGPAPVNIVDVPARPASSFALRPSDSGHSRTGSRDVIPRSASALSHRRTTSELSSLTTSSGGTPVIPEGEVFNGTRNITQSGSNLSPTTAGVPYIERGQRWVERQEVRSLRTALEEMDVQDDENRLFEAAQDEATELVLEHQTNGLPSKDPNAAYRNPDLKSTGSRLRQYLERNTHARTSSLTSPISGQHKPETTRSASDSSSGSSSGTEKPSAGSKAPRSGLKTAVPDDTPVLTISKNGTLRRKRRVNFALPEGEDTSKSDAPPAESARRSISGGSSKGLFRNPEDSIYEEPEDTTATMEKTNVSRPADTDLALTVKPHNSVLRGARPLPNRWATVPTAEKPPNRFDIHKNPPSQTRNPIYTTNSYTPREATPELENQQEIPTKNGIEIRDEDIRAATSMKLSDRSAKLPMPSAVSDRPGRPIVSFDPEWKEPRRDQSTESQGTDSSRSSSSLTRPTNTSVTPIAPTPIPEVNKSVPSVPTISIEGEGITAPEPDIRISTLGPTLSEMELAGQREQKRELPNPRQTHFNRRSDVVNAGVERYQSLSRSGVPKATCVACDLSIAGRMVTASSYRLHPECFNCFHCHTPLECVAFYPEPDEKRKERISQMEYRHGGPELDVPRFYCHLDFHELFSPRCKSCKTPIEGEVIVACGSTWHAGHFFCAECGDPFTPATPFVEKEGFAWCIQCHSRRTASKCKACRKPVLDDVVVSALGGQWHDECFRCNECQGSFGPDGRFFVRQGKPKVSAKGRQIGGPVELPVCESCESKRLKA